LSFSSHYGASAICAADEHFLERSSADVCIPAEITEKILRYHYAVGHEVMHMNADGEGLTTEQHREGLELFQSEVAPRIREAIPSNPLGTIENQLQLQN